MPYYSRRMRRTRNSFPIIPVIAVIIVIIAAAFLTYALWPERSPVQNTPAPVAQFLLTEGKARITLAGGIETTVEPSQTATQLNVGESVEALGNTRIDVFFQNGSSVKLDSNSAMRILSAEGVQGATGTSVELMKGNGWVKTTGTSGAKLTMRGRISEVTVNDGSMTSVARNSFSDTYRGMAGSGLVRVFDTNGGGVLTEATLALGQQMTITDTVLADLRSNKPVQLAQLIDADFRTSGWYVANMGSDTANANGNANGNPNTNSSASPAPESQGGPTVTIVTPREGATLSSPTVTITGTASSDAVKVVVNDYALLKYVPGTTNWTYLASPGNGNLLKGENIYTVYALDKDGKRGETITLSINYTGNATAATDALGALKAPTINGQKTFTTGEAKYLITGTVPATAAKVVVNGFVLQKYVPGSGTWSYTASLDFGTMKPGVNVYTVYYVDKAGNKSAAATMQITYKKGATGSGANVPG